MKYKKIIKRIRKIIKSKKQKEQEAKDLIIHETLHALFEQCCDERHASNKEIIMWNK